MTGQAHRLVTVSLLAFVSGVAEATALLLAVRVVVDIGAGGDSVQIGGMSVSVTYSLLSAALAEAIALVCHALIARGAAALASTVLRETRSTALARYIDAPWSLQSVQREGALQELVTSLSLRSADVVQWLAFGSAQAIILASFVLAAFVVDWAFTLIILFAGSAVVLVIRPLAKATQVRAREFVNANSDFAEEAGRFASSTMELAAFGVGDEAEDYLQRMNEIVSERQYAARFSALFAANVFKDIAVFLLIGSVAGLFWLGQEALASAGVVITLIIRGLASAQQASAAYQGLSETLPSLVAFNARVADFKPKPRVMKPVHIGEFSSMHIQDVSYSYGDESSDAIKEVNIRIDKGDFLGIVGPSGSGKSTLLQLILRLRQPDSGNIFINGKDYGDIPHDEWHDFVSLVPQEPSLMEATIAENIAYYRSISIDRIREAAIAANIFDEIMRLPAGFETRLGPRGSGLSGGQKQRVAIARAMAGNPSLLVLDEPTSALDTASEAAILATIEQLRGSTTMVLVAHRLSTVERCDYLIEVVDGRVKSTPQAERGPV